MSDWLKLHRSIEENELWFAERFTKAQAWIDLLLLATYKPRTVFIRGVEIRLKPGELCYSQLSLAKRWKWNFKTVKSFLNLLEKREMLETKTGNLTTVISIRNWTRYQSNGDQNGEQMETKTETNKKVKKGKKDKGTPGVPNQPKKKAEEIYAYYASAVRAGARADALRNIEKRLHDYPAETLTACVDNYAKNWMPADSKYRIQANNFFGRAERFKEYVPAQGASQGTQIPERGGLTVTERILLERMTQNGR